MALIYVHKIMIGTALAFSLLFSIRAVAVGDIALAAFFGVVTLGLGIYFRWFLQNKADKILSSGTNLTDDA